MRSASSAAVEAHRISRGLAPPADAEAAGLAKGLEEPVQEDAGLAPVETPWPRPAATPTPLTGTAVGVTVSAMETTTEILFDVTQEADGGFCAEAVGEDIFTQADTWPELRAAVAESVAAYFFDRTLPARIRLHLVRDEVLATP